MSGGNLDGFLSPYLRRQRLDVAAPHIRGRVLDYGCGEADVCALAGVSDYVGVDLDDSVLQLASRRFPTATFCTPSQFATAPPRVFDTIVMLAVIEHMPDPPALVRQLKQQLSPQGRIVLTTPNPMLDWAHGVGARFGIFARESHDEHQSLMDRRGIEAVARSAGCSVTLYRRFLFGANQLAVLT